MWQRISHCLVSRNGCKYDGHLAHSSPSSRSSPGVGLVFGESGTRPVDSRQLQEVEVGRCCLSPLGAQGQQGDAWCGVFTMDWFAYLAPCCFARRPKRSPRRPQTAGQAPPRENFPFVKGDFPCWAWGCVQKNSVGSSESVNSQWPVLFLLAPWDALQLPVGSCPSRRQGHTCTEQTGCTCPSWTVPFVPFSKIK